MQVVEIFESIQGEGKYAGTPALFIRLAGCNRRCPYCDSKYALKGKAKNIDASVLAEQLTHSNLKIVVFTGGEPLLQFDEIKTLILDYVTNWNSNWKEFHLETNGDLLLKDNRIDLNKAVLFSHIEVSPKEKKVAKAIYKSLKDMPHLKEKITIKVVTDMRKVGRDMLKYADIVMPLTTFDEEKDRKIAQKVWNYCVKHNKKFGARLHIYIWGRRRSI